MTTESKAVPQMSSTPTPKMAERIAGDLRRRIVRGVLKEGEALPPEVVLIEQFGVSRPTLREAYRVLESEGLITVHRGAQGGARAKAPSASVAARYAGLVLEHGGTTLKDVYDARSVFESSCAAMAAERRTDVDLLRLRAKYEEISAVVDVRTRIALHAEFDALVVAATGSQTMVMLSKMLRSIIDRSTLESVLQTVDQPSTVAAYEDAHRAHLRLIELIEAQDADGAARQWRRHLDLAQAFVMSTGVWDLSVLDLL